VGRALLVCCIVAVAAPVRALAAPPAISVTAAVGQAPLTVTLTATGDRTSYHWDFGDGTSADGATVEHTYTAGRWTATATAEDGTAASTIIEAQTLSLTAPRSGEFGRPVLFRGSLVPATAGIRVALYQGSHRVAVMRTHGRGSFRVRLRQLDAPGPYVARTSVASSKPVSVAVRPRLDTSFTSESTIARPITLTARLVPSRAGTVRLRIWNGPRLVAGLRRPGSARLRLTPPRPASYRAEVTAIPRAGYLGVHKVLQATVIQPNLQLGAYGPSVRVLEERLAAMHYALRGIDSHFGDDTYEAVLAFQKVHGLTRTGRVDEALWRRIETSPPPTARYPGNHVEVDKSRQVLFEVRGGRVVLAVHVSTGATGNTPIGVWHVYRRVTGFDWVLYYPTYFLRGFAIHGYPDVPAYPASHGCVRVPMWVAQRLYEMDSYGDAVYVY
jgi:N-acetylmuramoyl-L-alanine amidase